MPTQRKSVVSFRIIEKVFYGCATKKGANVQQHTGVAYLRRTRIPSCSNHMLDVLILEEFLNKTEANSSICTSDQNRIRGHFLI
ncbi:hypothetical protein Y032_0249g124 [Ancylostoma ceylanicum]|uniref:Uncharacterized protein n=1 Tax=Ancylostoma ceylanicum TaxID=53326 RepID=A0A016SD52_9BILA|nr:hypothetical protein Y032_0249g124 [Ancylostoma ceylanicum]